MTISKISAMEFDSIVPVDDLCMAVGLLCTSQRRALRHYVLPDGRELTVNTARNEWAMKNPDCYGNASQLAIKLSLTEAEDLSSVYHSVERMYAERMKTPTVFPFNPFSRESWDFLRKPAIQRTLNWEE